MACGGQGSRLELMSIYRLPSTALPAAHQQHPIPTDGDADPSGNSGHGQRRSPRATGHHRRSARRGLAAEASSAAAARGGWGTRTPGLRAGSGSMPMTIWTSRYLAILATRPSWPTATTMSSGQTGTGAGRHARPSRGASPRGWRQRCAGASLYGGAAATSTSEQRLGWGYPGQPGSSNVTPKSR